MRQSRLIGRVRRALVIVGAVLGVGLLCAGGASADGPVELRTRLNDSCLDSLDVVINPCNGSNFQRWVFNPAGQIESMAFTGRCLSIIGPGDGAAVALLPCQGLFSTGDGELWNHQANGQVTSAVGTCLAVWGGMTLISTPVIGYHCTADTLGQQWDSVS